MIVRVCTLIFLAVAITMTAMVMLGKCDGVSLFLLIFCSIMFGGFAGNILTSIAYTKE